VDGKQKASEVLRRLRRLKGLTQRDLADLAHVPQPTIAAIETGQREPSLSLLSRIVESAGYALRTDLAPLPRFGAINIAHDMKQALQRDEGQDRIDDSVLRLALTFRDFIRGADEASLLELIDDPPNGTGDARWDAFLAATVEDECARRRIPPPRWVNNRSSFLKPFWHLSENPRLHEWEFETSPAAFLRHGVVVAADELASI
jgi:transcriptional regulator with XRE-family HTH domain